MSQFIFWIVFLMTIGAAVSQQTAYASEGDYEFIASVNGAPITRG